MKSFAAWMCWISLPCLMFATGCETRSYPFFSELPDAAFQAPQSRPDGSAREVGPDVAPRDTTALEVGTIDVTPNCSPNPEVCNEQDDDCDGLIDEDIEFNTDPSNCGRCGNVCALANSASVCSVGRCKLRDCNEDYVDLDRLEINGCECQITSGGQELCDGIDNNCNGLVDEGFGFDNDPANCGGCGKACLYANAGAACAAAKCAMQACTAGFVDLDKAPQNGCEYACSATNAGVEICDGKDNNCDGKTDDADPLAGTACFPQGVVGCNPATGACGGGCKLGTWACLPGGLVCQNPKLPDPDICDSKDNDCDGATDEDFDLQNDPRWCGACGYTCALPNAINGCALGQCKVTFCKAGFVDLDTLPVNGCEYACTPDGPEVCDGKDNDCDGKTDEADSDLKFPPTNFCLQVGECGQGPGGSNRYPNAATFPVCTPVAGSIIPDWYCNYPASVQLFAPNQVLGQESWCDSLDNDCDGAADEHTQPRVGTSCKDTGLGECQKQGVLRCQADRDLAPACDVSAAQTYLVAHETCDNKDNDCDGITDESWNTPAGSNLPTCSGGPCLGVRDETIHVTAGGNDYFIYKYEATRPDATATDLGKKETRACAGPVGKKPWTSVTHTRATAACKSAGMRLCRTTRATECTSTTATKDEWGFACAAGIICPGNTAKSYPYSCTYAAATCHGADISQGDAAATGSFAQCIGPDLDANVGEQNAFDMSGNVAEWTEDCRGVLADGRQTHTLRGGSYLSIPRALQCDFMATVVGEDFAFVDTGFRCCSSCAAGLADCSGTCVSLGTSNANCGACGVTCGSGQTCTNGSCR